MKRQIKDPFEEPATPFYNRVGRLIWGVIYIVLFRPSPRPFHPWRSFLLRCFGAKLGPSCHIYPKAVIWAPWNLECEDHATIADEAIIYNPSLIYMGSHSTVSQQAYLCGATHDYEDPNFPMISASIILGQYSWICARANVQSGVHVGEGAILGLGSLAVENLKSWTVYGGVPAKIIKARTKNILKKNI